MNQSGSLPANARLESMANHKSADFSQRMNTYFKKNNTYFIRFFLRSWFGGAQSSPVQRTLRYHKTVKQEISETVKGSERGCVGPKLPVEEFKTFPAKEH